jgi:hypothetical protein
MVRTTFRGFCTLAFAGAVSALAVVPALAQPSGARALFAEIEYASTSGDVLPAEQALVTGIAPHGRPVQDAAVELARAGACYQGADAAGNPKFVYRTMEAHGAWLILVDTARSLLAGRRSERWEQALVRPHRIAA